VANAMPMIPAPNFLSAPRRVTDRANPLASSSNFSFILFLSSLYLSSANALYAATALQLAYIDAGKKTILRGAAEAGLIASAVEYLGFSAVLQSKPGQRNAGETNTEFLQRPAPRHGLSHSFGQFIEFVIHDFSFLLNYTPPVQTRAHFLMHAFSFGQQPHLGGELQSQGSPQAVCCARVWFGRPKAATAIAPSPALNFLSAPRRVTDWANPFANSSNL
jgi:hypothetical protein